MKKAMRKVSKIQKRSKKPNQIIITKASTGRSVKVDFDEHGQSNQNHIQNQLKLTSMPTLNKDKLYYTPFFHNCCDSTATDFDRRGHLYLHNERVKAQETQIDESKILVPKPSEKNSYCLICKERFTDYLSHLNETVHVQRQRASQYQEHIKNLCSLFDKERSIINDQEDQQLVLQRKAKKRVRKDVDIEELHKTMSLETQEFIDKKKKTSQTQCQSKIHERKEPEELSWQLLFA